MWMRFDDFLGCRQQDQEKLDGIRIELEWKNVERMGNNDSSMVWCPNQAKRCSTNKCFNDFLVVAVAEHCVILIFGDSE